MVRHLHCGGQKLVNIKQWIICSLHKEKSQSASQYETCNINIILKTNQTLENYLGQTKKDIHIQLSILLSLESWK